MLQGCNRVLRSRLRQLISRHAKAPLAMPLSALSWRRHAVGGQAAGGPCAPALQRTQSHGGSRLQAGQPLTGTGARGPPPDSVPTGSNWVVAGQAGGSQQEGCRVGQAIRLRSRCCGARGCRRRLAGENAQLGRRRRRAGGARGHGSGRAPRLLRKAWWLGGRPRFARFPGPAAPQPGAGGCASTLAPPGLLRSRLRAQAAPRCPLVCCGRCLRPRPRAHGLPRPRPPELPAACPAPDPCQICTWPGSNTCMWQAAVAACTAHASQARKRPAARGQPSPLPCCSPPATPPALAASRSATCRTYTPRSRFTRKDGRGASAAAGRARRSVAVAWLGHRGCEASSRALQAGPPQQPAGTEERRTRQAHAQGPAVHPLSIHVPPQQRQLLVTAAAAAARLRLLRWRQEAQL